MELVGRRLKPSPREGAELNGFIDEDGYVDLFLRYTENTYKLKGSLKERGTRLTGILQQFSGGGVVSIFAAVAFFAKT